MKYLKIKDGFSGELQINVPRDILINHLRNRPFLGNLFITHIGYFPKAKFHYRERPFGCADNILIYCVSGEGHYQTATDKYTLRAGHFFVLPPGAFHMYEADIRNPWTIYWVHFSGNMVKDFNTLIKAEQFVAPVKISQDKQIIELWSDIYSALEAGFTEEHLAYANLSLYRLLTFFLCPVQIPSQVLKKDPVAESVSYMKANIDRLLTVTELAARQKLSSSYYTMLFKNKTGRSPIDYFIRLKIQYASQLLKQSNLKINEIASEVGYEDVFYFSRLFRKTAGISPSDYRIRVMS